MKLVFEEGEKERIEQLYEEIRGNAAIVSDDPDRLYALSFKVTNPAIANRILTGILFGGLSDVDLGIKAEAIHYSFISNIDEVKTKLIAAIDTTFGT